GMELDRLSNGKLFLGPVSAGELRVLYQHAVALVFPSLYEGFGLPPLEAMAAGTPVIAMRCSAVPEGGGDAVLYAEGLTAMGLARAMEKLAQSEALRGEFRPRGLKRASQFPGENTAAATAAVYRSVVQRPRERSLHARRMLREPIIHWSNPDSADASRNWNEPGDSLLDPRSVGVRNAWRALNLAVKARLKRELKRLDPTVRRRSA